MSTARFTARAAGWSNRRGTPHSHGRRRRQSVRSRLVSTLWKPIMLFGAPENILLPPLELTDLCPLRFADKPLAYVQWACCSFVFFHARSLFISQYSIVALFIFS
ncbi:unnamed protein product, partial [Laminaria digitata]